MHSDPAAIKKSIRTYLMIGAALFVGTVITVLANQVHLAVPLAITVALIIAAIKGSMVAGVFMHLSHEKRWIYGSLLLTVAFFIVLITIPLLSTLDHIGTPIAVPAAAHAPAGH
ncbi:MAG: cytochrome C oxidase subunit IV family protein [Acidobacteriota bacterium]